METRNLALAEEKLKEIPAVPSGDWLLLVNGKEATLLSELAKNDYYDTKDLTTFRFENYARMCVDHFGADNVLVVTVK